MGFAKRELEEEMDKKLCIECGQPVKKRGDKWYCHECDEYFVKACPSCVYVYNPLSDDEVVCPECYQRALERMD